MRANALVPIQRCPLRLGLLAFAIAACDAEPRGATLESDSAGVRIVESRQPLWSDATAWRVEPEPAILAADRPAGRGMIGVVPLPDGGLAVADVGTGTLVFHDARGRDVRVIDVTAVPAPFTSGTRLYRIGDELLLSQRGLAPTLVFDLSGEFLRSVAPAPVDGLPTIAQFQVLADGSLLAIRPPQGLLPRRGTWTENAEFLRLRADGTMSRILSVPAVRFANVARAVEAVGYGPVLAFAIGPDRLFAGYPESFDIGVYALDGTPERRIRRAWTPVPVPREDADSLREAIRRMNLDPDAPPLPDLIEHRQQLVREFVIAEHLPAHGRLILDDEGHLWVERVPPTPLIGGPFPVRPRPSPWDVFDPRGGWLGTVELPASVWVTGIGNDGVAGIRRTGESEQAVLHRLIKPTRVAMHD